MPTISQIEKRLQQIEKQLDRLERLLHLQLRLAGLTLEELQDLEQSEDDEIKLANLAAKIRSKTQALSAALADAPKGS